MWERAESTAPAVFLAPEVRARIRERILARPFLDFTGLAVDRVRELLDACESDGAGMPQVWSLYVLALWFHEWV